MIHRPAIPPKGGWRWRRDSLSKLKVYVGPGEVAVRYSYDWRSPSSKVLDQELGAHRLEKLLFRQFVGFESAILIDLESDTIIRKYNSKGHRIPVN